MRNLDKCLIVSFLAVMSSLTPAQEHWPGALDPIRPDEETMARLRQGEVLVENILMDESGGAARVQALFEASPEAIWGVVGSCESNFRFVDGLKECQVLAADERYARTRQVVKKNWFTPRLEYVFEAVREPYSRMVFRLLEGDLRRMEGSWRFEPLEGGGYTLVTHEIQVQPKLPSPRWLVRRTMKNDMPDMLACLRALAGGSGSKEQLADDRKRCPKDAGEG